MEEVLRGRVSAATRGDKEEREKKRTVPNDVKENLLFRKPFVFEGKKKEM